MPPLKNSILRKQVEEYYLENKHVFKDAHNMSRAFIKDTNTTVNLNHISQRYFRPLFKNRQQEEPLQNIGNIAGKEQIDIEETKDGKIINYKGEKSITSLEEAIKFFEVDLTIWEVESYKCKSWDTSMKLETIGSDGKKASEPIKKTNYSVNINLKKKLHEIDYKTIEKNIDMLFDVFPKIQKIKGTNIGVLTIADIHIGLKVSKQGGVINTPDFNVDTVIRYLSQVAEKANALGYKELHLVILGDLVESVSGYNHIETLKEMESSVTGGNIIILAHKILSEFILKLKNLKKVYMISGNHDRLTPDKAMDKDGGACQLIAYMLQNIVNVQWHPLLISVVIDNINYILTHGHLKITNQDLGKIFFEYGSQDLYNVMLSGHWHVRKQTKVYQEKNLIMGDTSKYRAIVVPPIVSGSRFTEENGWSCAPGFIITQANGSKRNIHFLDYSLN